MKSPCCTNKCDPSIKSILQFLKLISDENRLKIICLLSHGEKCVCEIWQDLGISQNLASHHLKVLKDFNILKFKKNGLKVIYKLNDKELKKYKKILDNFLNPKPTSK